MCESQGIPIHASTGRGPCRVQHYVRYGDSSVSGPWGCSIPSTVKGQRLSKLRGFWDQCLNLFRAMVTSNCCLLWFSNAAISFLRLSLAPHCNCSVQLEGVRGSSVTCLIYKAECGECSGSPVVMSEHKRDGQRGGYGMLETRSWSEDFTFL